MSKKATIIVCLWVTVLLCGCSSQKNDYGETPRVVSTVEETDEYTIYRHEQTGVWYFCRNTARGQSVVVMVNPDGTPYIGEAID